MTRESIVRDLTARLLGAAALGVVLPVLPAAAQEQPAAAEGQQIEEVIVTARKREESIMKVPVVASALTAAQLASYDTGNLNKIADQVPGLKIGSAVSAWGNQVSLRGVGTSVLNATIDQSVSLNVDGMQMTQGLAYSAAMFDMSQVSVLKGPQALFYGKASPGGVISINTADPTNAFDVVVRGGYESEAKEKVGEFIISGPVSDSLKLRLASKYSESDGFFKNVGVAAPGTGALNPTFSRVPNTESWVLRGTALWEPTDRFKAKLKLNYAHADIEGAGWEGQYMSCPDGTRSNLPFQFLGGGENCVLDRNTNVVSLDPAAFPGIKNGGVPFNESEQVFGTLELNYDLGHDLTLTSVTGWYRVDQSSLINGTVATYSAPAIVVQGDFEREDVTQELRLTSDYADSPVNFTVGAFYQKGAMDFAADLPVNTVINRALGGRLPPKVVDVDHNIKMETLSAFGQVLWNITPKLELGAGARWTEEDRDHKQVNLLPTLFGRPAEVTPLTTPHIGSSTWSPELTLTYTPTDDLTFFGSLKQAYKSGSFDSSGAFAPGATASFGDEKVQGGEAGIKSRLLDNDLHVNLAAYDYKYEGLQLGANAFDPISGTTVIRTTNAASAKVYGVDFDAIYMPSQVDGLTLQAGVEWNHARYGTFDNAQCWGGQRVQDGCNLLLNPTTRLYRAQDLSGKRLMRAPDWSANFGFNYERPIAKDMTLSIGATTTYSSSYYTNVLLRDDMRQDSYFKTNANITLKGPDDGWELALIGANLGNEITSANCVNGNFQDGQIFPTVVTGGPVRGPGGVEELQCTADPGRSVLLRLTLRPLELLKR